MKPQCHKNCNHSGKYISHRLRVKDSVEPKKFGQQQDGGNKAEPLSASPKNKPFRPFPKGKEQGRIYRIKSKHGE